MAADVKLHFPVVAESFPADVALEGCLAGVEPDVNLEPVAVGVLAGAEAANQRRLQLKEKIRIKANLMGFRRQLKERWNNTL